LAALWLVGGGLAEHVLPGVLEEVYGCGFVQVVVSQGGFRFYVYKVVVVLLKSLCVDVGCFSSFNKSSNEVFLKLERAMLEPKTGRLYSA
jgi:hypothetical protein